MRTVRHAPPSRLRWACAVLTLLAAGALPGQVVRIEAQSAYAGWVRCAVDQKPPHQTGAAVLADGDVVQYVVGRSCGLDTHVVDLRVDLKAGQRVQLDLANSQPTKWQMAPLPALDSFGGWPHVAGLPMGLVSFAVDGAAYAVQLRVRTGGMLCTELWLLIYPDQLSRCTGEVRVTCSDPTTPSLFATVPADYRLTVGDAQVGTVGHLFGEPLVAAGTAMADGQCRAVPVLLVWPRHCKGRDFDDAIAMGDMRVHAVGIRQLLADGNPSMPVSFDARAWADGLRESAVSRLHNWAPPACGPVANSGNTGEQEDQVFKRAEPLLHERAVAVTYLSALKYANRPCHHLEASGTQLDLAAHPNCVMWSMRPDVRIGPDLLGKPSQGIADWDVPGGWWGADEEHALFNTLAAGARYTGSYALQAELGHIARNYLFGYTVKDGLSTTRPGPARAYGWEGILAVHLWRELEDRPLAGLVKQRWQGRFDKFAWMLDRFDVRVDDPRLGPGPRYMPWQEGVKVYGLDLGGAQFDRPQARSIALGLARRLVVEAHVQQPDGSWRCRDIVVDGAYETPTTMGFYDHFGMPMVPAVILRNDPGDATARSIWNRRVAESTTLAKYCGWLAPGVPQ